MTLPQDRDRHNALPRVIVLYEDAAFGPLELAEAARGVCEIVWVTGWSAEPLVQSPRLLSRLGVHVDVTGCDAAETATRVRAASASGITVFSDGALEPAAALAHALGLTFHDRDTAHRLRDKFAQRRALSHAGMDVPRTRLLTAESVCSYDEVDALDATWPAVLKPRRGAGSVDTFIVSGPDELLTILASVAPCTEFVLEDYLADRPGTAHDHAAAMFSVELLVERGVSQLIALTGRFPLEPPLRESGSFLPGDVGAADARAAVRAAGGAARALGVQQGILHIEFKRTPEGPRIIEVNGRVGGIVPHLLRRVGGAPIITCAFQLALGMPTGVIPTVAPDGPVAFYRAWLPPAGDFRLTSVSGLQAVAAWPEVDQAWLNMRPGDTVSSRVGGGVFGYAAAVFGTADSHEALWQLRAELDRELTLDFESMQAPALAVPIAH
jgi:biotin carboxylase